MTHPHHLTVAGAALGALGVAAGAFGAHALQGAITADALEVYETAAKYHLVHGLATVLAGIAAHLWRRRSLLWSGRCFVAGTVLFSGSLYALALGGPRALGFVTPFGGTLFIAGWILLAVGAGGARK
jgi:uncharacterized membrane protein YgdD (TMEM256/DUF423 family)